MVDCSCVCSWARVGGSEVDASGGLLIEALFSLRVNKKLIIVLIESGMIAGPQDGPDGMVGWR